MAAINRVEEVGAANRSPTLIVSKNIEEEGGLGHLEEKNKGRTSDFFLIGQVVLIFSQNWPCVMLSRDKDEKITLF